MTDLPIIIEKLDAVPEEVHKFYTSTDEGKYQLNATELYTAMSEKGKALDNERKVRSDFEKRYNSKLKEFEGLDKSEYQKLKEEKSEWEKAKEEREQKALTEKGKFEEALNKTKESYEAKLTQRDKDNQAKIKELEEKLSHTENTKRNYILGDRVRAAIAKSGIFPEDIEDVYTLTKSRFDLDENLNVVFKNEIGEPDSSISLDKFYSEIFKKAKPKFYQAHHASGSGKPAGSGTSDLTIDPKNIDSVSKIAAGMKNRRN